MKLSRRIARAKLLADQAHGLGVTAGGHTFEKDYREQTKRPDYRPAPTLAMSGKPRELAQPIRRRTSS